MYLDIGKVSILSGRFAQVIYMAVDWIIHRKGESGKWTERSTKLDKYKIYILFKIYTNLHIVHTTIVLKQLLF